MFIVTAIETVGDISACIEGGMDREATDTELSGGVICDGLGSAFAAFFGVLPNTSFSQNVGLVSMTKVVNRFAISMGAIFLILCGFCPKIGAIMSIMPQSVLGGAAEEDCKIVESLAGKVRHYGMARPRPYART